MLWEFVLAVLTFIQIPSEDSPPNPVQFDPSYVIHGQSMDRHFLSSDLGMSFMAKPKPKTIGPQTPQERALARKALHRPHKGGDMIFPKRRHAMIGPHSPIGVGSTLFSVDRDVKYRWPGYPGKAKIPYVIDKSIAKQHHSLIKQAMDQYNKLTCVKFTPRFFEKDYIRIFNGKDDGCWSVVGKNGGKQDLSLGDGCQYIGTIVHELGHAAGLLHEHQRHDRDNHIVVHQHNIQAGLEDQFHPTAAENEILVNDFDHKSIMIYGNYAFSKDYDNLMTMEALNGEPLIEPYDKPGLDNSDIYRVNMMYGCR